MAATITASLDVMGGDEGVNLVIPGADIALTRRPDLRFRLYGEEAVVGRLSQRTQMRRNRDICERYADSYPNTDVRDLLFTGKSGLGKTFLLQAIAHRVARVGVSVNDLLFEFVRGPGAVSASIPNFNHTGVRDFGR